MIFIQLFDITTLFFLLFIDQRQKREKEKKLSKNIT